MLARQTGVALAPADTARRVLRWLALRGSPPGNRALPDRRHSHPAMAENQIQNQDQNGPIGLAVKAFLLAFEIRLEDNGDDPTIPPGSAILQTSSTAHVTCCSPCSTG